MRDLDLPPSPRGAGSRADHRVGAVRAELVRQLPAGARRALVPHGDRIYALRGSEVNVLRTVGRFRAVRTCDLPTSPRITREDVMSLSKQGLIMHTRLASLPGSRGEQVLMLTAAGRRLLRDAHAPHERYQISGVKRRELAHDALVYRLYRDTTARIETAGGRVEHVRLDDDLKRALYARPTGEERELESAELRAVRAEQLGLPVLDGHVQIPDLQLEYRDRDEALHRLCLEIVTPSYKAHHIAAKARAGFVLHLAPYTTAARGGPFHTDRDLPDLFAL
jgi:hypothetical protein